MLAQAEKTPDLRVRRTRLMLTNAFMELLKEQTFQSITVQDIADRAMVNRATFYDHFTDKIALFEYSMRVWFEQTLDSKLTDHVGYSIKNLEVLIATLCEFLAGVGTHCRTPGPHGLPSIDSHIAGLVRGVLKGWLGNSTADYSVDMASWAIYGAATHWSEQKSHAETAEKFAERVAKDAASILGQG